MTNEELQKRIEELERVVRLLSASSTIPLNIDNAFTARLEPKFARLLNQTLVEASDKAQEVNESGSNTYDVASLMDGFFEYHRDGTVYYIPYYTN
jgi:hypothetical protein